MPFRLTGTRVSDGEGWDEQFAVVGTMPQGPLADLGTAIDIKDGTITYGTGAVVRFLRAVVVPEDRERFEALISDVDRPVAVTQLGQVMLWAIDPTGARPTGPSSTSTPGGDGTAAGSEAEQPGQDTPPAG